MEMEQASGPAPSQIPDLIKIGAVSTDTAINVQTDILDPVIFSESEARFVLDNKGILHSNSRITFSTAGDAQTNASGRAFFPANVGVHSLIQRAALRVGTKTVCEIEDYNHFAAYETVFLPPDAIKEREQVMSGRFMTVEPGLDGLGFKFHESACSASRSESLTEAKAIKIDNGKDSVPLPANFVDGAVAGGTGGRWYQPISASVTPANNTIIQDYQDEANKPTYSILLADLFPFLKMNQLPLYMMSEQVSIHLTFAPQKAATSASQSERLCTTGSSESLVKDATLVRSDCQMIADYIYYPQDMMEQYRQANSTMTFSYVDYQFVKRTVTTAEYAAGLIQNVGGAGRVINKVIVASEGAVVGNEFSTSLLNRYKSTGPQATANTTNKVTVNLKYNDNFLFPVDVSNSARLYHNVFSTEGRVPYISRDLYRGEGQLAQSVISASGVTDFENYGSDEELARQFFWTAYRLNKGERVNSRGIELYDTRTGMDVDTTLRAYLQVVKVATLRDGIFESVFA